MASLGIDTVKHAAHLREPDNQGTYFFFCPLFFSAVANWRSSWIICTGWRVSTPHKGKMDDRIT